MNHHRTWVVCHDCKSVIASDEVHQISVPAMHDDEPALVPAGDGAVRFIPAHVCKLCFGARVTVGWRFFADLPLSCDLRRMKHLLSLFLLLLCFPAVALAQDPASLPVDLSTGEALELLLKSLGGMKGAGALGIAAACVQGVMLFFRTPLANFAGKWRLVIVTGLTLVCGVLALKLSGVDWLASLTHSATLASVTVFGNQLLKQFRKDE